MSRDTEDQKKEITNYRIRETDALKSQRLRLTNTITSVALSPVYAYFEETKRADGIKMEVVDGSPVASTKVNELHSKFVIQLFTVGRVGIIGIIKQSRHRLNMSALEV